MSLARTTLHALAFSLPAIFVGLAAGFHQDAVLYGVAAAAWLFIFINYQPR